MLFSSQPTCFAFGSGIQKWWWPIIRKYRGVMKIANPRDGKPERSGCYDLHLSAEYGRQRIRRRTSGK